MSKIANLSDTSLLSHINMRNPILGSPLSGKRVIADINGGNIPIEQGRRLFTDGLLEAYVDNIDAPLRGMGVMFPITTRNTLYVNFDVKRGIKYVAPYSNRGDTAVLINDSKYTERRYKAPYMNLATNLMENEHYSTFFGEAERSSVTGNDMAKVIDDMAMTVNDINNMMLRTMLKQIKQIAETASIVDAKGGNIFYDRTTSADGVTPANIMTIPNDKQFDVPGQIDELFLIAAGLINKKGHGAQAGRLISWIGSEAWDSIKNNALYSDRLRTTQDQFRLERNPDINNQGNIKLGELVIGSYVFEFWGWNDNYVAFADDTETNINYINPRDVHIFDPTFRGETVMCGVPMLPNTYSSSTMALLAKLRSQNPGFIPFYSGDTLTAAQYWGLRSAPISIPKSLDKMVSLLNVIDDISPP